MYPTNYVNENEGDSIAPEFGETEGDNAGGNNGKVEKSR